MGENKGGQLPQSVINYIRGGRIVIIATADADGRPNSAPFSWVVAVDTQRVRFAANHGIATLENVRRNGYASLTITAPDLHYTFRGSARVIKENVEAIPFPAAVVEVTVEDVKDDSLIGRVEDNGDRNRWTERRRLVSDSTIIQAVIDA
jgi:hypothetical protein